MSRLESVGVAAGRHEGETETDEKKQEQRRLCVIKKKKEEESARYTIVVLPVCRCACLIGFLSVWHAFRKRSKNNRSPCEASNLVQTREQQ